LIWSFTSRGKTAYDGAFQSQPVSGLRGDLALTERTMFLFSVLMFFLFACVAAWLALFPAGREVVVLSMAAAVRRIGLQLRGGCLAGGRQAATAGRGAGAGAGLVQVLRFLQRRYLLILSATVLLTVPTMLALVLSGRSMLGGYDSDSRAINDQVTAQRRAAGAAGRAAAARPSPRARSSWCGRCWSTPAATGVAASRFQPAPAARLQDHEGGAWLRHGLLEGYRSPARQDLLAAMGSAVTNARAFQSWHQYGLAADCAFLRDGKLVISEKDPWAMRGYQLYGEVAESLGLTWGGRWTMMDFGHTELRLRG
jgi:peptidoglycan L-alanyl-D-glutamate endopeptidase CwlK